jgi:hypothetical protein
MDIIGSHPPAVVREFLDRCGTAEEFVAWWICDRPRDPHESVWVITFNPAARRFSVSSFPRIVSHWGHQVYGSSYGPAEMKAQLEAGLWDAPDHVREAVGECLVRCCKSPV